MCGMEISCQFRLGGDIREVVEVVMNLHSFVVERSKEFSGFNSIELAQKLWKAVYAEVSGVQGAVAVFKSAYPCCLHTLQVLGSNGVVHDLTHHGVLVLSDKVYDVEFDILDVELNEYIRNHILSYTKSFCFDAGLSTSIPYLESLLKDEVREIYRHRLFI